MNILGVLSIIVLSLLIGTTSHDVYGQYGGGPPASTSGQFTLSITTEKSSYLVGEAISLSGNVDKYDQTRSLQISIFNAEGSLALNSQFPVESDGKFSFEVTPNAKFSKPGEYTLRAQYGRTNVEVKIISFIIKTADKPVDSKPPQIETTEQSKDLTTVPEWVKNNAGWWADGKIDDNSFVQGIQFLIKEGFMKIPTTQQGSSSQSNEIPSWIKQNAKWWADGKIDDNSFVQGIQFLIKEGFMKISL